MIRKSLLLACACFALAACASMGPEPEAETDAAADPAAAAAFASLADKEARRYLAFAPEQATELGVGEDLAGKGFAGRLGAYSPRAFQQARTLNSEFAASLADIDRDSLSADDAVSYDVLQNALAVAAQRNAFGIGGAAIMGPAIPHTDDTWALTPYLVTQLTGPHLSLPRMLQNKQPLKTAEDAENYLARLGEMSRAMDEIIATLAADRARGATPPRFAIVAARKGVDEFMHGEAGAHPLVTTLSAKLKSAGIDDAPYASRAAALVEGSVIPAWKRLDGELALMEAATNDDAGVWRLGEAGARWYQMALDAYGAGGRTGDEIHQIGVSEVARITAEMDQLLRSLGLAQGTVAERVAALGERADQLYPDTDEGKAQLLGDLRSQVSEIMARAPDWFGAVPAQAVEVRRIPAHEEDSSPGGYYSAGSVDGTRPGIYWINLKSTRDNPKLSLKTLTYHEAVPGHHFQFAYQRQIGAMPLLRNALSYSEFEEGWALYSEELAKEMGMYEGDAAGDIGRLQAELFRAARLVVDTGLHEKRWSRDEAIDYMVATTGQTRDAMTREVERYAVAPGQACSYKLGMLKIGELRREAEAKLGKDFNIRAFHDVVLRTGAAPLPVLEARVRRWVAEGGR